MTGGDQYYLSMIICFDVALSPQSHILPLPHRNTEMWGCTVPEPFQHLWSPVTFHCLATKRWVCSNLPYNYRPNYYIILSQFNPFICLAAFLGLSEWHSVKSGDAASGAAWRSVAQLPAPSTARWARPEC